MKIVTSIDAPSGLVEVYIDDEGQMVLRPKRSLRLTMPAGPVLPGSS